MARVCNQVEVPTGGRELFDPAMVPKGNMFSKTPTPDRRFVNHKHFASQFKDTMQKLLADQNNQASSTIQWQLGMYTCRLLPCSVKEPVEKYRGKRAATRTLSRTAKATRQTLLADQPNTRNCTALPDVHSLLVVPSTLLATRGTAHKCTQTPTRVYFPMLLSLSLSLYARRFSTPARVSFPMLLSLSLSLSLARSLPLFF